MPNRLLPLLLVATVCLAVLIASGCSSRQDLRATEGEQVTTVDGYRGAHYPLTIDGEPVGEATLWATGVVTRDSEAGPGSVAGFGITIENNSDADLRLDPTRLALALRAHGTWVVDGAEVSRIEGPELVPPEGVGDYHLDFVLPNLEEPRRIDAARLNWAVVDGVGAYRQVTPFIAHRERRHHHHHHGGPRVGVGFHFGHFWHH